MAGSIGVDELRRRHSPSSQRRPELAPRSRAVDGQCRQLPRTTRLGAAPSQRIRQLTVAVESDHDAVPRVEPFVLERFRSALDGDLVALNLHVDPAAAEPHLSGVLGVDRFDVEILHVGS
jgi:hypothetical protein